MSLSIAELENRLTDERAAANPIVDAIRALGRKVWDTELPREWYSVAVARELTRRAVEDLYVDAGAGMVEAQIAVTIATQIEDSSWPRPVVPQLRAEAFKNLSTCHRYCGNFEAAHRALDAAERAIEPYASLGYDRAVLQLARAIALVSESKRDGVAELLREALEVFREHEDQQRIGQCLHVLGMFLWLAADYEAAAKTLREAAALALQVGDYRGSAGLASALGHTLIELGDISGASAALMQARSIMIEIDDRSEDLHITWGFAKIHRANGHYAAAGESFSATAREFESIEQFEDAGMCWLEAAECAIALDAPAAAREYLDKAVAVFAHASLPERLATALEYARELARAERPREEAVRHVRRYLREKPQELFLAPPE